MFKLIDTNSDITLDTFDNVEDAIIYAQELWAINLKIDSNYNTLPSYTIVDLEFDNAVNMVFDFIDKYKFKTVCLTA